MSPASTRYLRTLAIDPCSQGFGFVVIEEPDVLIDWGVARLWARTDEVFLFRLEVLINRYTPALLVVEDGIAAGRNWTRQRIGLAERFVKARGISLACVSRHDVKTRFNLPANEKLHRAIAMAERFPELEPLVPGVRKPWASEDARMNIFDALALALAAQKEWDPNGAPQSRAEKYAPPPDIGW